jgi:hypothetical protein
MKILAIDPSISATGVAFLEGQELRWGRLVRGISATSHSPAFRCAQVAHALWELSDISWVLETKGNFDVVVIEWPVVRNMNTSRGDNSDLLLTAGVAAAIAVQCPTPNIICVKPEDWKGQVDPDVMTTRIMSKLSPMERERLDSKCPTGLMHNVLDAVGLGRWYSEKQRLKDIRA